MARKKKSLNRISFSVYELSFNNQSKFAIFVFKTHLFKTILECDQNTGEANTPSKQWKTPGFFFFFLNNHAFVFSEQFTVTIIYKAVF